MLFVVNFKQNLPTASVPAAGFYAICFPNPVSNQGGLILALTSGSSSNLPQTCIGIAATVTRTVASTYVNSRSLAAATTTYQPFYFLNLPGSADITIAAALPQTVTASNVAVSIASTHTWAFALWNDCTLMLGNYRNGWYVNGVSALSGTYQPPFCFGISSTYAGVANAS